MTISLLYIVEPDRTSRNPLEPNRTGRHWNG